MTEKRIAETINVRVNVGNYQHIEITKYAEKQISYETSEEMVQKEDELTNELLENLIRNMKKIPERLGKNTDAIAKVEEAINKGIPRWLEESPEPNIANAAKDKRDSNTAEQKDELDKQEEIDIEGVSSDDMSISKEEKPSEIDEDEFDLDDDDLFN